MPSPVQDPIFLVGPTAVGKSEVALLLAEEWNAEIVSADSMQVYRGMDIGTAKPTTEERRRVPHHVIDVVDVRVPFNVAEHRKLALAAIEEIQRRGRTVLVVGGSGLYVRALREGFFEGPGADPNVRQELEAQPTSVLYERLKQVDPSSAATIGTQNKRRLVRALEVWRLTGTRMSEQQSQWERGDEAGPALFCLERDRPELYHRIEERVDWMFANGLVEETERLLRDGLSQNPAARTAAGYREVIEMIEGVRGLSETKARVKTRTRQLAKRQLTWFRHQVRVQSIRAAGTATETKERIREAIENARNQVS